MDRHTHSSDITPTFATTPYLYEDRLRMSGLSDNERLRSVAVKDPEWLSEWNACVEKHERAGFTGRRG